MRIGITCGDLVFLDDIRIFSNGHHFNVFLWYHFFEKCGYDPIFLSNTMNNNIIHYENTKYNIININSIYENESNLKKIKLDYVLFVGLTSCVLSSLLKKHHIKRIYSMLGNVYSNDLETVVFDKGYNKGVIRDAYDEIWISPHFAYSLEYYKIRYGMDNIQVAPYIWGDNIVKKYNSIEYKPGNKLLVAICEANISNRKNCMIPLCICEKSREFIEVTRCYGTQAVRNNRFFLNFVTNLNIHKSAQLFCNNREPIVDILQKCNCVISTNQEWDLNYVFLECFYHGIPLIHNSKMLKNYGYYYPDLDINEAAKQVEFVFNTHNTKLYIEKHKELLHKYSINNTYYHEWVKHRLPQCPKEKFDITSYTPVDVIFRNNITIILTTTVYVDCNKEWIYQTNSNERILLYLSKIKLWLENTKFKIVLVENSGYTYPELKEYLIKYKERFEIITYKECDLPDYNIIKKTRTKGISELYAINYAYDHSLMARDSSHIIKITGRYYIDELENYLNKHNLHNIDCIEQRSLITSKGEPYYRCELIGCSKNIFKIIFSTNGNIDTHIEDTYHERISAYTNTIVCKHFSIEPTQMGGVNHIAKYL
jgi:hypothetical protein